MNWSRELKKIVKGKIRFNEFLYKHTTFRIGGAVDVWVEPKDIADLKRIINFSRSNKIPLLVIGAGSNILAKDRGFDGIIIKLDSPCFKKIEFKNSRINVGSGLSLARLINLCKQRGFSGPEFLVGIPGTVGGALVMNAGIIQNTVFKRRYLSIGDLIDSVKVLDSKGKMKVLKRKDLKFAYRKSNLSKYIILSCSIELRPKNKKEIAQGINEFWKYRKRMPNLSKPNAGCIFKNPNSKISAGYLIELAGLKSKFIGGAYISDKHANYILNNGRAKAKDVLKLIKIIRSSIKHKFGIDLQPEIKIIG